MVAFVRKRLQVFVSSTFTDLIAERQAAVEAILTAGHIPAGMELFTSGSESQMVVIKQWIDESDVYLLILGGRYGSVEPTTLKSYTQIEYQYAVDTGKPLFSCVINETALDARVKTRGQSVLETENAAKLREFRALVLSNTVRFWDDAKDIKISIGETLSQIVRQPDLVGWVKSDQEVNASALADEIARLSKENSNLRKDLDRLLIDQEGRLTKHQALDLIDLYIDAVDSHIELTISRYAANDLPSHYQDGNIGAIKNELERGYEKIVLRSIRKMVSSFRLRGDYRVEDLIARVGQSKVDDALAEICNLFQKSYESKVKLDEVIPKLLLLSRQTSILGKTGIVAELNKLYEPRSG